MTTSSAATTIWSPSRSWFLWLVGHAALVGANTACALVLMTSWLLAMLHVSPPDGSMQLAGHALWLIGPIAGAAWFVATVAVCYSLATHMFRFPGATPRVESRRIARCIVLIATTTLAPLTMFVTTDIHPAVVGLLLSGVSTAATAVLSAAAIRAGMDIYRRVSTSTRFNHRSTRGRTDHNDGRHVPTGWDAPNSVVCREVRRLYAATARLSARLRRVAGGAIVIVTTSGMIPVAIWSWGHAPGPLTALPMLTVVGAWVFGVMFIQSANDFDRLAELFDAARPVPSPQTLRFQLSNTRHQGRRTRTSSSIRSHR